MLKRYTLLFSFFLSLVACNNKKPLFESLSPSETGISFQNSLTESDDFNILDYLYFYNGGGVAIGDINNDGLPDIYFSGNQVKNKLYLNKGGLTFEDITEKAGVSGNSNWNTGAVMGDVNGDGFLDIYVCAVVGIRGLTGYNELFINNGDNTFTENAAKYGLDHETFSSSAAFLDYDLDGDLDIFLLNHAIHTQESFGHANLRHKRSIETGDKLMRNDGEFFTDISEEAGIYGGINGYGLGVAISDFNQDGFPDIYVGNDFHEDDYYYVNNGNGTFTESLKKYFGHTSRFSMGNDVADLNHDGMPDIISLDMLPEDEKILKSSDGDEEVNIMELRTSQYGYHYQFSRNTLQINQGTSMFAETALMSGIAATDWSWSSLFADFDQDGEQDLFISNGIPKRPNDLDFIKFVSNEQIKEKIDATKLVDQQALDLMPSGAVRNYLFKGTGNLTFENKSDDWIPNESLFSAATAMGDLDNDGDLDLVINNINGLASLYINQINEKASYLKLKFDYRSPNTKGVGTKVFSYHNGKLQYKELFTVRGFQSSSEPTIHFGYEDAEKVDSIRIIWPDNTTQTLKDISVNQVLTISPTKVNTFDYKQLTNVKGKLFELLENNMGIDFIHIEDKYIDFDRQRLMPYQVSDRGPATAIGDINNDGKTDIFFGGSKFIPSQIYVQIDSSFEKIHIQEIENDSIKEDVTVIIQDLNNDDKNDILVGSGGADFYNQMKPLLDSYYLQSDSSFVNESFPEYFENASVIKMADYDNDGDLDAFIGNLSVSNDYGNIPNSYLLNNENGEFSIVENIELQKSGMITDAVWSDYNNDGEIDLIVVGEWMSPKFFKNQEGELIEDKLLNGGMNGLWQSIAPFDIDKDGDIDYVLGNWGLNSKFNASEKYPMKMYYHDFDNNGSTETILAIEKNGKYYTLEGLDELSGQLVTLRKKFTRYKDFAGKTVEEIFDGNTLKSSEILEVSNLKSGYLKNDNGNFYFHCFPSELQIAPIMALLIHDFDKDGKDDLLAGGNYFGVKPFHGRFDAFSGALIKNETDIKSGYKIGLDFTNKSVRDMNIISINNSEYLLVTINNAKAQLYKLIK
ncbi:MAG: VCBS repeat-containing protein [Cyclobacteriaceae bacterium]|nr:VCBS repeat-containing protein [Cyclobacteriaceae bacterium]